MRDFRIDINEALLALGSGPILEASEDTPTPDPGGGGGARGGATGGGTVTRDPIVSHVATAGTRGLSGGTAQPPPGYDTG